jgi:hypothetical protein
MSCPSSGCASDQNGCSIDGLPLAWVPGSDITFAADLDSAFLSGVSADDASLAVELAVLAWSTASCADAAVPSVTLRPVDESGGRAKVRVKFRGDSWPYPPRALAGTHLEFDLDSGAITRATVEVNTFGYEFSLTPYMGQADLVGVLTHEIGHAIGLDHSRVPGATMVDVSSPFWTEKLATPEQDDVDGLCSLYPPGAKAPESPESAGCSMGVSRHPYSAPAPSAFAGLLLAGSCVLAMRRQMRA